MELVLMIKNMEKNKDNGPEILIVLIFTKNRAILIKTTKKVRINGLY